MKPLFILLIAIFTCSQLSAQNSRLQRTTASAGRWYSHVDVIGTLLGSTVPLQFIAEPLWYDSTILSRYTTGLFPNQYASIAEWQEPPLETFNDSLNFGGLLKVTATDAYMVDSVSVKAFYVHQPSRPSSVIDTLIIAVAPEHLPTIYYLPSDTITEFAPKTDGITKTVLPDSTGLARTVDTFLLNPVTMGIILTGTKDTFQEFKFPVNSKKAGGHTGCSIPAGFSYAISVTFKSGDTWKPNVDSISEYNVFAPAYAYEGTTLGSDWMSNWYMNNPVDSSVHDMNMTSILRATILPYSYVPGIILQKIYNTPTGFPTQYALISGHVICPGCKTIGGGPAVVSSMQLINNFETYPNPASDKLYISYHLNQKADASIYLVNVLGQVVRSADLKDILAGKTELSLTGLPNGVYTCSIHAGLQQSNKRIVIMH